MNPGYGGYFGDQDDREATSAFSAGSRTGSKKQRKVKMYEWPEQQDPEMERRRQLAIKQKKKRDRDGQEEMQTRVNLTETQKEIESMKTELAMRNINVSMMKQTLAAYGHTDDTWLPSVSGYH